jgi:hypothetical protein
MRLITILTITSTLLFSDSLSKSLSFQGFTGVINTPNAEVIDNGTAIFHFNNQFDNHLRGYDYSKDINFEENYIFGIGFFPSLEIVGRLVESKGYARDLSANIKYKIPYSNQYLPNIAIGIQDLGGAYNFYNNKYIVADKELWFLRISLGYGKADEGVTGKRMDGLFGGVEAEVTDWLSIMAEHDGEENHAGVKISLPKLWISRFNIETTIARNLTNDENSFGFNLVIPLDKKREEINRERKDIDSNKREQTVKIYNKYKKQESLIVNQTQETTLLDLQKVLVDFGFENVRVGTYGDRVIYVECENSIFDHNDLDALGYIIGEVVESGLDYRYYTVTLLKNELQTVSINGSIIPYRKYIKNPTIENLNRVKSGLIINREIDTSEVKFISEKKNSSLFRPRLELSTGLITPFGTELGVFDYLLALRSNLYMPLYKGLMVSAMYELPFANSDDFDNGGIYNKMYSDRVDSRLVNANLHQTLHYKNIFNTVSLGRFETDYYGILNQTNLSSTEGEHAISFKIGTFKRDSEESDTHNIYEGSYRYFYEPAKLFTTISYGEYWYEDSGVTFELKRFFGDIAISLEYKNLENQYIGARVSLPLTFRKLAKASPLGQIKGKSDFKYGIRSTIRLDDGTNRVLPFGGKMIKSDFILESYYLNRDRLSSSYILGGIDRMREAYLRYK